MPTAPEPAQLDLTAMNGSAAAVVASVVPVLLIAILFEKTRKKKRPLLEAETDRGRRILEVLRAFGLLCVACVALVVEIVSVLSISSGGLTGGKATAAWILFISLFAFVVYRWMWSTPGFEAGAELLEPVTRAIARGMIKVIELVAYSAGRVAGAIARGTTAGTEKLIAALSPTQTSPAAVPEPPDDEPHTPTATNAPSATPPLPQQDPQTGNGSEPH